MQCLNQRRFISLMSICSLLYQNCEDPGMYISWLMHTVVTHWEDVSRCWTEGPMCRGRCHCIGSVAGVMECCKYNRAVNLLYEAFMPQAWKGFLPCRETNHTDDQVHLEESLRVVNSLCEDVSQAVGCERIENQSFEPIFKLFDVYLDYLIQENGTLLAFWISYVDIVDVLLGLVRASRECVWVLHLAFIRAMIPWCFADDKLNSCTLSSLP